MIYIRLQKAVSHGSRRLGALGVFLWMLAIGSAHAADTLYFIATLDSHGNINQSWFSADNWYFPDGAGGWTPANKLPTSDDTAVLMTSPVQCAANSISVNTLILKGVNVVGGNFSLINLSTFSVAGSSAPAFNGSTVQVQNEYELSVGPFGGTSLFNQSTLIIDLGGFILLDPTTTLEMVGPSTLFNEGQIVMTDGTSVVFAGGTNHFSILKNAVVSGSGNTGIVNGGAPGSLLFDNNGQVRGDGGLMILSMGGVIWTNSFGVGQYATSVSNATVEILGSYVVQPGNTNKFFGPGLIWFFGNIVNGTINGEFLVGDSDPTPGTIRWDADIFGTGRMDVIGQPGAPSQFLWDGGTINAPLVLNIDGWSQLILTNVNTKRLSGATVNNGGPARWVTDTGAFTMDNGATFNNLATGSFTVENSAVLQGGAGTNLSVFNNFGLFRRTNNLNYTQFLEDTPPNPGPVFNNSGTLDVATGRLLLQGGTNTSQFNVAESARLEFQANYFQNPGAYFTGGGTNILDQTLFLNTGVGISNLNIMSPGIIDGPGDLTDQNLLIQNGNSTIQGSGALIINPNTIFNELAGANLSRNVTNGGMTFIGSAVSSGSMNANTNIFWANQPSGSVSLFQGAGFNLNYVGGPAPIFNNAGLVQNAQPSTSVSMSWAFTNSGQVSVSSNGIMAFNRGFTQTAGSTVVSNRATLTMGGSTAAAFILGGTLSGNGTINGNIVNSGTFHPGGSPGQITLNGVWTNNAAGVFAVELDGTIPGTQFSQLNNNANQTYLGGTLSVSLGGGYKPALGDSFKIYTNGTSHGVFSSLQGMHVGNGIALVPIYHSADVTLVAANDPIILAATHAGNTHSFSFQSTAGLTNVVEFTDALNPTSWQTLTTIPGDGTIKLVVDPNASVPKRFYRVRFQ